MVERIESVQGTPSFTIENANERRRREQGIVAGGELAAPKAPQFPIRAGLHASPDGEELLIELDVVKGRNVVRFTTMRDGRVTGLLEFGSDLLPHFRPRVLRDGLLRQAWRLGWVSDGVLLGN